MSVPDLYRLDVEVEDFTNDPDCPWHDCAEITLTTHHNHGVPLDGSAADALGEHYTLAEFYAARIYLAGVVARVIGHAAYLVDLPGMAAKHGCARNYAYSRCGVSIADPLVNGWTDTGDEVCGWIYCPPDKAQQVVDAVTRTLRRVFAADADVANITDEDEAHWREPAPPAEPATSLRATP